MGVREAVFLALSVGVYLWREVSAAGQVLTFKFMLDSLGSCFAML